MVIALVAAALVAPVARGGETQSWPTPRTLATIRGDISAFAQDGELIGWVDPRRRCDREVQVRNLRTRVTRTVWIPRGPTCADPSVTERRPTSVSTIALARNRVLWARRYDVGLSHCGWHVFTGVAAGRRGRLVAHREEERDEDTDHCPPIPMAGAGATLVFAPFDARRVGERVERVPGTDGTRALAVAGNAFALVRRVADEAGFSGVRRVEGRSSPAGELLWRFDRERDAPETIAAVAFDGARVALLVYRVRPDDSDAGAFVERRVEIRALDGTLMRAFVVEPDSSLEFALSGNWFIYRTLETIRAVDIRSGSSTVITTAPTRAVVGLSVSGARLAWAEQRRGSDVVRAVQLPSAES
jgi:hypothetical protein